MVFLSYTLDYEGLEGRETDGIYRLFRSPIVLVYWILFIQYYDFNA